MRLLSRTLAALCLAAACLPLQAANPANAEAGKEYERARYFSGQTGERLDLKQSAVHLRKAAELGHLPAQVELAFVYFNGNQSVPRDHAESFRWFSKAASAGSLPAQCMLGDFYKDGLGGVARDPAQAVQWYRRTATVKDRCALKSQYELYVAYESGAGVRKNLATATRWLKKSASGGNPRAQGVLGRNYLKGYGVPQDEERGREWIGKSREGVAPHDDEHLYRHKHKH